MWSLTDYATQLQNFNGNSCGTGATASLAEALERSCNTAFAELAADLGEEALRDQAEAFGIGTEEIAIPMGVANSTIGDIEGTAALQQSSIGQRDVALTPMQNAMVVAGIANGGRVMAPYLINEIQGQDLESIDVTLRIGNLLVRLEVTGTAGVAALRELTVELVGEVLDAYEVD